MHYGKFALAFKITNWCNLNCAHCCENSSPRAQQRLLSLDKIEKYLYEFKELPYNISEYIVIGGGEGLAPYLFGNTDYIPDVLLKINSVDCISTIKTNGVWGNNPETRKLILGDLADVADKIGKLVTLDISVDEFHNNIPAVANIFAEILDNEYITKAIRPTLVGFKTQGSADAFAQLKRELLGRGLVMCRDLFGNWCVANTRVQIQVICDFESAIFNMGRAKKNNVATFYQGAPGLHETNCIQIDNQGRVTLNYYYREKIKDRPLKTVMNSLIYRGK